MVKDKKTFLLVGLYAVIAMVAVYTGYRFWVTHSTMQSVKVPRLGEFQGPADAEKIIVEFVDYRCSHCREVHHTLQEVMQRNPDVKVVYRHYLVFGRPSLIDAEVALAAGMQGKFTEAHNALIQRDAPITDGEIDALARGLGLDMEKFRRDMKGREVGMLLLSTIDAAEILGVNGTPTFIVGDKLFNLSAGMPTVEVFEQLLQEEYGS